MTIKQTIESQIKHAENLLDSLNNPAPKTTRENLDSFLWCARQTLRTTADFLDTFVLIGNEIITTDEHARYSAEVYQLLNELTRWSNEHRAA